MKVYKPSENPITQGYLNSHKGYDFAGLNLPDEVRAGMDGEIIERVDLYTTNWTAKGALTTKDYGNYIKIKHDDGTCALFAHLLKGSSFEKGTKVKKGQTIAKIGNTGNSTGPHLHSEYRNASNVNVEVEFITEPMAVITQKELDEIRLRRDLLNNILVEIAGKLNIDNPSDAPAERYIKAIEGIRSATTACQNTLTIRDQDLQVANVSISNKREELARKGNECQLDEKLSATTIQSLKDQLRIALEPQGEMGGIIRVLKGQVETLAKEKGNLLKKLAGTKNVENAIIRFVKFIINAAKLKMK